MNDYEFDLLDVVWKLGPGVSAPNAKISQPSRKQMDKPMRPCKQKPLKPNEASLDVSRNLVKL